MKDQSQTMYAFLDHFSPHSNEPTIQETPDDNTISSTPPHSNGPTIQDLHHLSNYCGNMQPLHSSFTYTTSTPPHSNEPTIQETRDGNNISSTPPHSNEPTIQESPDGNAITTAHPYLSELPIQETPDGHENATSGEGNRSP
jgi:hypothetical protein